MYYDTLSFEGSHPHFDHRQTLAMNRCPQRADKGIMVLR